MLIRNGDLIRRIEGHETPDTKTVLQLVGDSGNPGELIANAGDPMSVTVEREKQTMELRFPWRRESGPVPGPRATATRVSRKSSTSTHLWKPASAADR